MTVLKTPRTKIKNPWQEGAKITRTRTFAQNPVRVKIENAEHHGLMHGHRPKNKPPNKTNARFVTPNNTNNKKNNTPRHVEETQSKNQEHEHALQT